MRLGGLTALLPIAVVLACGGGSTVRDLTLPDGGDGGFTDGGPGKDAAGGGSASCPAAVPASGAACIATGARCEYGGDPDPQCNVLRECSATGAWTARSEGPSCPTPPASSDARCPRSYGASDVCGALGTRCGYPEGRCACVDTQVDAGTSRRWACDAPTSTSCPRPRPRLGTSCAREGQTCNYGACVLDGGVQIVCQESTWRLASFSCTG